MRACILMLLFLLAGVTHAQEFNAGIVKGLWYSQDAIFAGATVRIYVAIRNNTGSDLVGTVEFFDGDRRIERKNVQALDGRIIESWADWTPTYGEHTITANLSRIELQKVGTSSKEVEVTSALAEDTFFVDYDTDNDGVGNETDGDDDGDTVSDAEEKQNGTNPLVPDAPEPDEEEEEETDEQAEEILDEQENTPSAQRRGLERYLAESPAENVFTSVTEIINTAKEDLDAYRTERQEKQQQSAATSTETYVDGFGTVNRATSSEGQSALHELSLTDFFASTWSLAKTLFNWVYTFILTVLSFILGHPTLVQVGTLLLILMLILKLAAKFGRRPKNTQ